MRLEFKHVWWSANALADSLAKQEVGRFFSIACLLYVIYLLHWYNGFFFFFKTVTETLY